MNTFEMIENLWSDNESKILLQRIAKQKPNIISSNERLEKLKDMGLIVKVITKNPHLLSSHYELTQIGEFVLQELNDEPSENISSQ